MRLFAVVLALAAIVAAPLRAEEAPLLAAAVKEGKLPPEAERLPKEPRVVTIDAATGREPRHVALVEAYARLQGFWFEPDAEPRYTSIVDIDLDEIVRRTFCGT